MITERNEPNHLTMTDVMHWTVAYGNTPTTSEVECIRTLSSGPLESELVCGFYRWYMCVCMCAYSWRKAREWDRGQCQRLPTEWNDEHETT